MTQWDSFAYFGLTAAALWIAGAVAAARRRPMKDVALPSIGGLLVYVMFILLIWRSLGRPPMRTLGETRMWYAFFMPAVGVAVYSKSRYRWLPGFAATMAIVFILINICSPETHDKTLMPALQSIWFVPHVAVYMMAYALLGASFLMSVWQLVIKRKSACGSEMSTTDNLVATGVTFLTFGMLFGAIWAKEAWGHYWTWDPKETWAAASWLACLVYIHFRHARPKSPRTALLILILAFVLLQMCWWGINYLPSARTASMHTYGVST